ncbi:MAG TPA: HU family DNA-binding protein [Gemmataceae bacterium]|nr:HU family DNA-binding protein [Gemmataceae bacterium]
MADKKPKAANGGAKPMSKTAILQQLADSTGLKRKDVAAVFDSLNNIIRDQVSKKGPGVISLFRLFKIERKDYPASKGGEKKINPLTKQEYETKPKPAHSKIKVRALKDLKGMV